MSGIPKFPNENLLVGFESSDDACVYKISEDTAIVSTVDFFPPIVDDPYTFGLVGAANSLSDVWAMGGYPTHALNMLTVPDFLPDDVVKAILEGGAAKCREAGCAMVGGHCIIDPEPKYGLAVSGIVDPRKILANNAARVGDRIIMTKEIGTGVLTTAYKADEITMDDMKPALDSMCMLNKYAAEAAAGLRVHSCTDITGFGLGGHLCEMAEGAGLTAKLYMDYIPLLPKAYKMAKEGLCPAGTYRNLEYFSNRVKFASNLCDEDEDMVYDPQTSGGLLIALPAEQAEALVEEIKALKKFLTDNNIKYFAV